MNNQYVHAFVLLLDHNLSIHITKIYIKFALHHDFAYSAISALMPSCIYSVRDISSWTVHVMCIHVHVLTGRLRVTLIASRQFLLNTMQLALIAAWMTSHRCIYILVVSY